MTQVRQIILFCLLGILQATGGFLQGKLLQFGTCSLAGFHTFHTTSTTKEQPIIVSLSLKPTRKTEYFSLQIFNEKDQRTGRLELAILQDHLQVTWNDRSSTLWIPILVHERNHLEISFKAQDTIPSFKLNNNGKEKKFVFHQNLPREGIHSVIYDEEAQPDENWLELQNDPEIINQISHPIQWSPPVISFKLDYKKAESAERDQVLDTSYLVMSDDSDDSFKILSVSMSQKSMPSKSFFSKLMHRVKSSNNDNPLNNNPLHEQNQLNELNLFDQQKYTQHIFTSLIVLGFSIYLLVLLRLSKMTSVRPSKLLTASPSAILTKTSASSKIISSSSSSTCNVNTSKKTSDSHTVHLQFPDAPHLKSSISTSGSVLKLTVPAAFNLADNRHIIFPSKLRNFQK